VLSLALNDIIDDFLLIKAKPNKAKPTSSEVQYMHHAVAGLDVGRSYRRSVPRFGNRNVGYIRNMKLPVTHILQSGFGRFSLVVDRIVEYHADVAHRVVVSIIVLTTEGIEHTEVDLRVVAQLMSAVKHISLEVFPPDGRVDIGQGLDGVQAEVVKLLVRAIAHPTGIGALVIHPAKQQLDIHIAGREESQFVGGEVLFQT